MKIGSVVIANAGKEKGGEFVVVGIDERFVYLADGKRLKASKPKKKAKVHVKLNGQKELALTLDELNFEKVNAKIRNFLKKE